MAAIWANIWMKSIEVKLSAEDEISLREFKKWKQKCPICLKNLVWKNKIVEFEECENWYHIKYK